MMADDKMYLVRMKAFESGNPAVIFKPATTKGFVVAKNPKSASEQALSAIKQRLQSQFPKAQLKVIECKLISFDFFINN